MFVACFDVRSVSWQWSGRKSNVIVISTLATQNRVKSSSKTFFSILRRSHLIRLTEVLKRSPSSEWPVRGKHVCLRLLTPFWRVRRSHLNTRYGDGNIGRYKGPSLKISAYLTPRSVAVVRDWCVHHLTIQSLARIALGTKAIYIRGLLQARSHIKPPTPARCYS